MAPVLGGGTCDAGGVSSTANAAGDAVVVKAHRVGVDRKDGN